MLNINFLAKTHIDTHTDAHPQRLCGMIVILVRGVFRIFERGGPISLGSLKKSHQILKGGGSIGLMGGGSSTLVSLGRQSLLI